MCSLSELFGVGMVVPCKLLESGTGEEKKLELSVDPRDVNADIQPSSLHHGMVGRKSIIMQ